MNDVLSASAGAADSAPEAVLRLADIPLAAVRDLLADYALTLIEVAPEQPIPGSYWGECEAGIIGHTVYARGDTPVHSLLHEAGHLMVLPPERRAEVHTDATDSVAEEDATCYLQILLADRLPGVGRARLMADMDAWGYTFRLGSCRAWFEQDAEDARRWLIEHGLLDADGRFLQGLGACAAEDNQAANAPARPKIPPLLGL